MELPVLAGTISTLMFVLSMVPMLRKAARTKDLRSYSAGNLALSNAANAVYSVYVFSMPFGPIWLLHTFYVVAAALMLLWYLRYRHRRPALVVIGERAIPATGPAITRTRIEVAA